jgi:hypothetical protein
MANRKLKPMVAIQSCVDEDVMLGESFLFLGEIQGLPGRCAVVDDDGKVRWNMRTELLRAATAKELRDWIHD